jgi:branched-chain amino acid transport system permease protein
MTLDTHESIEIPAPRRASPVDWIVGAVVVAVLLLMPLIATEYFVSAILTQALWIGIAAASLIYLAGYGGMVSLCQVAIYGIAGFTYGNLVQADGGVDAAWNPWVALVAALVIATLVSLLFGLVSSRSEGIYFLMITLALGVIVYLFWGKVTDLSGFGGLNDIASPSVVDNPTTEPNGLYYVVVACCVLVYLLIRYVARTPFGLTLQGIRDDPTRMRALGYNVVLHRTLAFGFAGFIAAIAGILNVWWNTRIDPNSINLGQTIDVLVIAVIGGLLRVEGAWIGAIVFVVLDNYTRGTSLIGERFNTVIGVIFLVIVLVSPGGIMGIYALIKDRLRRPRTPAVPPPAPATEPGGT